MESESFRDGPIVGWTLAQAEEFLANYATEILAAGFVATIVGGLVSKRAPRKDADIRLSPAPGVAPRTFEQAHEAVLALIDQIEARAAGDMLESAVPGSHFQGVIRPNGQYLEFILEEDTYPFPEGLGYRDMGRHDAERPRGGFS